jgi:sulfopyruvate decarboxylase TPP-binding subunit
VTHVVGLPDNATAPLFDELARHPTVRLVTVAREGEAFALAAGLWLGGARPLVSIQNTGLLESGDALRGTAGRMAAAVPILVSGRGYASMRPAGVGPQSLLSAELLTRADVDSTALMTERTLDAWGVPFVVCDGDDDPAEALTRTIHAARTDSRPTALVLARSLV